MRIISLEFENINSYEGKVRIDFSDAEYRRNNNQFVISGETAAGKSTILDAISLALYGSTERVGRMAKNAEALELMNKKSGYCRASIIYECSKGTFRSNFYQQKAYAKKDGSIQNPTCSIENLDTHEFLLNNEKTTEKLAEQTEKLIGLNYDQFIRCTLIPQGEFARFINSGRREKASILAKLSRTEFYKKVGKKLCEEAKAINDRFKLETEVIEQIEVLSDEDRRAKESEQIRLSQTVKELEGQINELEKSIYIKQRADEAEADYNKAVLRVSQIKEKEPEYLNARSELENALKADRCSGEYDNMNRIAGKLSAEQSNKSGSENSLKEVTESLSVAKQQSDKCKAELEKLSAERKEKKALWDEVRKLDSQLSLTEASYRNNKSALEKADNALNSGRKDLEDLNKRIAELDKEISGLSSYLETNAKDEKIGELIAEIKVKKASVISKEKEISDSIKRREELYAKLETEKKNREMLLSEKQKLEEELASFVNSKHVLIASILKADLKPGNPCPVCGVEYRAAHKQFFANPEVGYNDPGVSIEERSSVAADISQMSDNLKEKEETVRKSEMAFGQYEKDIQNEDDRITSAKADRAQIINDINNAIKDWGLEVRETVGEDYAAGAVTTDIDHVISKLSELSAIYDNKLKELSDRAREKDIKSEKIKIIDINILEKDKASAETDYINIEKAYNEQKKNREALFGSKVVSEEEKIFDELYEESDRKSKKAEEELGNIRRKEDMLKSDIKHSEDTIQKLSDELKVSNEKYKKLLAENGFDSEASFMGSRREAAVITGLDNAVRKYESDKKSADDSLKDAKKRLEDIHKEKISEDSLEKLRADYNDLKKQYAGSNQLVGSLKEALDKDDKSRAKKAAAQKNIEDISKEREIYNDIKNMIGSVTGEDFEVFVQAIAMKSLIVKANDYLSYMLPDYSLVQKENEVDFFVRQTYNDGSSSDRSIKNFSGGEGFIISLSFALAIAEFAGTNGSVESIFLDEGFGTLSGHHLTAVIEALKKLSSTGKMLGIITHVDAVIQEFMQLEARKVGNRSILTGPGVYME